MDSSTLSQIFSGKRKLSKKQIAKISEKIGIPVGSIGNPTVEFNLLDLDHFAVISDWYHFAILDLTFLKDFSGDSKWIARKLSITEIQARDALERLLRLGMLKISGEKFIKAESFYTNYSEGITSAAHKEYQRQVIQKALVAIDECPQERKDITSMTIAADSRRLEQAKTMIKNFRRELCIFLESGKADSVLHLAVQLYPVTNLEN